MTWLRFDLNLTYLKVIPLPQRSVNSSKTHSVVERGATHLLWMETLHCAPSSAQLLSSISWETLTQPPTLWTSANYASATEKTLSSGNKLYALLLHQNSHLDFNSIFQRKVEDNFASREREKEGNIPGYAFIVCIFSLVHTNFELILGSYPALNMVQNK